MCTMVLYSSGRLVDRIYPDHSSIDDYLGLLKKKNESRRTVRRAAGLSIQTLHYKNLGLRRMALHCRPPLTFYC